MSHVVVGTAGHIDHGKTALVRRLTGIDTDRLKEERVRGISIDLGFAYLDLPSGLRIGIVDVPGHERFVKNMLAGATGVDLVLFVVAADEGVMPQTREHLAIVSLLGVKRGVVALTKSDRVDADHLALVRGEIEDLLAETPLRGMPVLPVSSVTGAGIPELLQALDRAAGEVRARETSGPVRLPVDRVFSVEGIGTVVTGTLWGGAVRAGDALEVLPLGRQVRVRRVEVHDQPVEAARAGQRVAIALHGIAREEMRRGDWVGSPGSFPSTRLLDVRLWHLAAADRPLVSRTRLRVHLGASELLGRVVLLDPPVLKPGEEGLAQLRLETPGVAVPGDRLVIRSYSPAVTIGGAVVVDALPPLRARLGEGDRARLATLESGTPAERLRFLARAGGLAGIRAGEAAVRLGVTAEGVAAAREQAGPALITLRDGRFLDRSEAWNQALERVVAEVRGFAERHRLRNGVPKGELKSLLQRWMEGSVFDEALEALLREGRLCLTGERVTTPDAGPPLTAEQSAALDRLEQALLARGFQVPDVSSLAPAIGPSMRLQDVVRYLVESGRAVKVTSELLYPRALWEEIERRVREHLRSHPTLTMAAFKDLFQVSRKYAVPILEHLDRTGFTRRRGDERVAGPRVSP